MSEHDALTEEQRLVLRLYLQHGGMVDTQPYYGPDAENARDSEYGVRVIVTAGGANLETTLRAADLVRMVALAVVAEER